jgi:hypothetical protein
MSTDNEPIGLSCGLLLDVVAAATCIGLAYKKALPRLGITSRQVLLRRGKLAPSEATMPWTYYDAEGKRVSEKAAVFKCNEVALNAPGYARGFGTVVRTEYFVHSLNEPELRKAFNSFAKMQAWFKEHGQFKPK